MSSLAGVIESLGARTLTVTRTETAPYLDGVAQVGPSSTILIRANVQPGSGRRLESPPEHDRTSETKVLRTITALRTRTPTHEPDVVEIDGEDWVVTTSTPFIDFDGVTVCYYEVEVERDDIG